MEVFILKAYILTIQEIWVLSIILKHDLGTATMKHGERLRLSKQVITETGLSVTRINRILDRCAKKVNRQYFSDGDLVFTYKKMCKDDSSYFQYKKNDPVFIINPEDRDYMKPCTIYNGYETHSGVYYILLVDGKKRINISPACVEMINDKTEIEYAEVELNDGSTIKIDFFENLKKIKIGDVVTCLSKDSTHYKQKLSVLTINRQNTGGSVFRKLVETNEGVLGIISKVPSFNTYLLIRNNIAYEIIVH